MTFETLRRDSYINKLKVFDLTTIGAWQASFSMKVPMSCRLVRKFLPPDTPTISRVERDMKYITSYVC